MSYIHGSIYEKLAGTAAVTSIAGTDIYQDAAPATRGKPFIVISMISMPQHANMSGPSGMADAAIQIDCYSVTTLQRTQLAEAVRGALEGFQGNMGTSHVSNVRSCFISGRSNTVEDDPFGGEDHLYRARTDFRIQHTES